MRLAPACQAFAAFLALAGSAGAATVSESDYRAAVRTFLGGAGDAKEFFKSYPEAVTDGLDGKWAPLYVPLGTDFAGRLEQGCTALPVTIRTTPEHLFVVTHVNPKGTAKFDTIFTPVNGNAFALHTDADALFGYLGLADDKATPELRYAALRANNGTATVIRQGGDILVIQYESSMPAIYGRCE